MIIAVKCQHDASVNYSSKYNQQLWKSVLHEKSAISVSVAASFAQMK